MGLSLKDFGRINWLTGARACSLELVVGFLSKSLIKGSIFEVVLADLLWQALPKNFMISKVLWEHTTS